MSKVIKIFNDKLLEKSQTEIQLLGPGENEQITMAAANIRRFDIDVKVDEAEGNLVYELKVPITQNEETPYAILSHLKEGIRIGFETGNTEEERAPSGKDGGPRGGIGGWPGKMGKRRGGKMPEPFELWTKVKLASKPLDTKDTGF